MFIHKILTAEFLLLPGPGTKERWSVNRRKINEETSFYCSRLPTIFQYKPNRATAIPPTSYYNNSVRRQPDIPSNKELKTVSCVKFNVKPKIWRAGQQKINHLIIASAGPRSPSMFWETVTVNPSRHWMAFLYFVWFTDLGRFGTIKKPLHHCWARPASRHCCSPPGTEQQQRWPGGPLPVLVASCIA